MLEIAGLERRFGGLVALTDVNLVYDGTAPLGIIGPNGSGKTTLFNLITGFLRPSRGAITSFGQRLDRRPPHRIASLGIRRTFQQSMGFAGHTVRDNLLIAVEAVRRTSTEASLIYPDRARAVETLLEVCRLQGHAETAVDDLTFGILRLLGVALALAGPCRLLLLDEPAAGMTDSEAAALLEIIRMVSARGVGVVVVDHHTSFIFRLCRDVVVLDAGKVIAEGTAEDVSRNPVVAAAYLGADASA